MPTPLTPEHFQLLPRKRLEAALRPAERVSETDEDSHTEISRLAKYELRRRQAQVPVRNRYASVHARSVN